MTRAREETGITLVEVLVAMALMLVVTAATLQTLAVLTTAAGRNQQVVDSVDRARLAVERLTRHLRGVTGYATSGAAAGGGILRADPFDMVFRSVAAHTAPTTANPHGVETVRYCLDVARGLLFEQRRPDVVAPGVACPDSSWSATMVVADVANGPGRPLFSYDAAVAADIANVAVQLFLDGDSARAPAETALSSGIYLRNQNRRPTAVFTAIAGPNRHVQLNGSTSIDPEGQMLTFAWKDGGVELAQTGPVIDYLAPETGPRTITLEVVDPGGLTHGTSQTVEVRR